MRNKRVIIVGASAWQVPAILKAKELGYDVAVVDYNPKAVGIQYADAYYNESTNDPEGIYRAAKDFRADGITTVAMDMPMRAIAYACQKLGLKSISEETALMATDKALMIQAFERSGVPHPAYFVVDYNDPLFELPKVTFPCICKPTDNSASRGVIIVNNESEFKDALAYSAQNGRSGNVIVEELMTGSEVSVEMFAVNGDIHVLQITDKLTTGAPHFVEMGHEQPSRLSQETQNQIATVATAAMRSVGIEDGPAHVEIMCTKDGPKMIELGARLGGDFITTDLVPLSTGIDMLSATIRSACGDTVDIEPKYLRGSAIRYMKTAYGTIEDVNGLDTANGICGVHRVAMLKNIGDEASEIQNSIDRVGYAIAQADTSELAVALCEKALEQVTVSISSK